MADYITIDGGTTNTRISLVSQNCVLDTVKFNIGARKSIDNNKLLRETIKNGIAELLEKNGKTSKDIEAVLASGMITSEFGLVKLDHIKTPAGIKELNRSKYSTELKDISNIPFCFIRGVKTDYKTIDDADMMRGEETELMGIISSEKCVYILPGSHSKILKTDDSGKIIEFKTMLTGEMILALSENTILKDSVDLNNSEINPESLYEGYNYCLKNGINDALFKVRVLKNLFGKNPNEIYNFYLGVILCDEIKYILSDNPEKIVIGGKKQIKDATAILLKKLTNAQIITVTDNDVANSSALGAVKIYEYE